MNIKAHDLDSVMNGSVDYVLVIFTRIRVILSRRTFGIDQSKGFQELVDVDKSIVVDVETAGDVVNDLGRIIRPQVTTQ